MDLARLRDRHLAPGLLAEFSPADKPGDLLARRVEAALDVEWKDAPGDGLPRDDFAVRLTGYLRVPATGSHTFHLLANEGARVFVDDKLVVEEPDGARKRKPTAGEPLRLTEGLHPLRVEFWDHGGLARLRVLWTTPDAATPIPIPPSALVHEIAAER